MVFVLLIIQEFVPNVQCFMSRLNIPLIYPLVIILFSLLSCTPEGRVTPRVLDGKWPLITFNNYSRTGYSWGFSKDGAFSFCYLSSRCEHGTFEWNEDKDEVLIVYVDGNGDFHRTNFRIEVLDKTTLKGIASGPGFADVLLFERE